MSFKTINSMRYKFVHMFIGLCPDLTLGTIMRCCTMSVWQMEAIMVKTSSLAESLHTSVRSALVCSLVSSFWMHSAVISWTEILKSSWERERGRGRKPIKPNVFHGRKQRSSISGLAHKKYLEKSQKSKWYQDQPNFHNNNHIYIALFKVLKDS